MANPKPVAVKLSVVAVILVLKKAYPLLDVVTFPGFVHGLTAPVAPALAEFGPTLVTYCAFEKSGNSKEMIIMRSVSRNSTIR